MDQQNRVVVLIDMDCFYCQVEEKLNPELKGKPIAVVQYNPWKGGGIIAVNYVARAMGVTRHMRGDEAREKCPELELPQVPCQRGKADITKYREAGKEVARVLQKYTPLLERASVDEAYLDITTSVQERLNILSIDAITNEMIPNTYALSYDGIQQFIKDVQNFSHESIDFDLEHSKRLLVGAVIVSEIRAAVYNETGYQCSAGIAHNKILAKLVCGMNKPNKQTILPKHSVNTLYKTLPIKKVKHLGAKFGDIVCETLKISKVGELQRFSEKELHAKFDEKNGTWLYNIARGIDLEPVQAKFNPKSIGCCKQLRGISALKDLESLKKWLKDLGDEIEDRLEQDALENNRTPKQMVVSFATQIGHRKDVNSSRSYNFLNEDELCGELFYSKALELILDSTESVKPKDNEENRKLKAPIKFLGISVGKFEDNSDNKKTRTIIDFFAAGSSKVLDRKNDMLEDNLKDISKTGDNFKKSNKGYMLEKFLKSNDNNMTKIDELCINSTENKQESIQIAETRILATLDKQESFFTRFLNNALTNKNTTEILSKNKTSTEFNEEQERSKTPLYNIVACGEDSNDTDCSTSTINNEINKSVALFEDDPNETLRVSNMRNLLKTSPTFNENNYEGEMDLDRNNIKETEITESSKIETIICPECKQTISFDALDSHSDYHMALNLRNEEREIMRKEKIKPNQIDTAQTKSGINQTKQNNLNNTSTITNFLVKFNENVPIETCSECSRKIPVEKLPEHLDFHEAQRLSREINKNNNKNPLPELYSENSVKRKRKIVSPVKKSKIPCRSIDSFFR